MHFFEKLPTIRPTTMRTHYLIFALICVFISAARAATEFRPFDCANIRGANYCTAGGHHVEHWLHYDAKETERDLDYAKKVNINQVRVFLSYPAYLADKDAFRRNLIHLARACQSRQIGLMPVVESKREMLKESEPYPRTRDWIKALLDAVGSEPAVVCWDVFNEPDYPDSPERAAHIADARLMARLFHELDTQLPRAPITIGFAYEPFMEQNADLVDVLSFHDYSPTRAEIRQNIGIAAAFAAKVKKPVVNSEIGCTARANPYDITIEEYSNAHMGFYIWELMITKYWGNVHGVFYPDGTVRDPSIAAAMMGIFRNRSANIVQEFPDREGKLTRALEEGRKWLNDAHAVYSDGLRLAETAANILEANQLVPMRDLPTRRVALLREGAPDPVALRELLATFLTTLEPYQKETRVP